MSTISQTGSNAASDYVAMQAAKQTDKTSQTGKSEKVKKSEYGKTIGSPELSEKAKKYYEQLKKKYSNMDFILVSEEEKERAQAQAGRYANPNSTVVLIDEAKIEKMAEDENYRKKYESIISGATAQLSQIKESLGANSGQVKAYGVQVKDGMASFFAVLDKSNEAQRQRIEKRARKRAEEKKEAQEAAEEKRIEKRNEKKKAEKESKAEKSDSDRWKDDTVTVTASSIEELLQKINDTLYASMSDSVLTEEERQVGMHFDFRG